MRPRHRRSAPEAPEPTSTVGGRVPVLDGWRGLAILIVVLHNTSSVVPPLDALGVKIMLVILQAGWIGVSLFFVLSGYLITGILLDSVGKPRYLRNFYTRRTLRIFPLYYGFLTLMLLVLPTVLGAHPWTEQVEGDRLWYWLYLSNWPFLVQEPITAFGHLWSLAVEEQFYVVWPLLVLVAGPRRFGWVVAGVVSSSVATRAILLHEGWPPELTYAFTPARMDALGLGALMALGVRRPEWLAVADRRRYAALCATLVAFLWVLVATRGFDPFGPLVQTVGQSFIALVFTTAMFITLRPQTPMEHRAVELLSSAPLITAGKFSYAMYVLHFPIHTAFRDSVARVTTAARPEVGLALAIAYMLAVLALSGALGLGSWHLFEKRFLALKDRWAPSPEIRTTAVGRA